MYSTYAFDNLPPLQHIKKNKLNKLKHEFSLQVIGRYQSMGGVGLPKPLHLFHCHFK